MFFEYFVTFKGSVSFFLTGSHHQSASFNLSNFFLTVLYSSYQLFFLILTASYTYPTIWAYYTIFIYCISTTKTFHYLNTGSRVFYGRGRGDICFQYKLFCCSSLLLLSGGLDKDYLMRGLLFFISGKNPYFLYQSHLLW